MSEVALVSAALLAIKRIAYPGTKKAWNDDHIRFLAICHVTDTLRDALNDTTNKDLVIFERDKKTGRFKRLESSPSTVEK